MVRERRRSPVRQGVVTVFSYEKVC
jgi:hypothetical protein